MNRKTAVKIGIDLAMTVLLMLLMAFELIGRTAHEWFGTGMLVLFLVHHILNRKWSAHLLKGKYTPFRVLQTLLVLLVLASILGSMISGIVLSRHVFDFLPISGGRGWARTLHLLSAYWGFAFMSLHLGLHWNTMTGMAGRAVRKPSEIRGKLLKALGFVIAVYGVYAFLKRELADYMFLRSEFVFFDFEEPLILFYVDYIAIMGLFIWIGHYLAKALRGRREKRKN